MKVIDPFNNYYQTIDWTSIGFLTMVRVNSSYQFKSRGFRGLEFSVWRGVKDNGVFSGWQR
jgi:hypothetical protein